MAKPHGQNVALGVIGLGLLVLAMANDLLHLSWPRQAGWGLYGFGVVLIATGTLQWVRRAWHDDWEERQTQLVATSDQSTGRAEVTGGVTDDPLRPNMIRFRVRLTNLGRAPLNFAPVWTIDVVETDGRVLRGLIGHMEFEKPDDALIPLPEAGVYIVWLRFARNKGMFDPGFRATLNGTDHLGKKLSAVLPSRSSDADSSGLSMLMNSGFTLAAPGAGGAGGDAEAKGDKGIAIGGSGGKGGHPNAGPGGAGGKAGARGKGARAVGGAGGDAAQTDGTGGQGGRTTLEQIRELNPTVANMPCHCGSGKSFADCHALIQGRGGDGAHQPDAERR